MKAVWIFVSCVLLVALLSESEAAPTRAKDRSNPTIDDDQQEEHERKRREVLHGLGIKELIGQRRSLDINSLHHNVARRAVSKKDPMEILRRKAKKARKQRPKKDKKKGRKSPK